MTSLKAASVQSAVAPCDSQSLDGMMRGVRVTHSVFYFLLSVSVKVVIFPVLPAAHKRLVLSCLLSVSLFELLVFRATGRFVFIDGQ